jgi:hypothetical protein
VGFKTRKTHDVCKIIVDIDGKDHRIFKMICKTRGYSIKEAIHSFIKQFNKNKIEVN